MTGTHRFMAKLLLNRLGFSVRSPLDGCGKRPGTDAATARTLSVDRAATQHDLARSQEIFGDLLTVRLRGQPWWTTGLTWEAVKLIGLEELMLAMYDHPVELHRRMAFLRDEMLNFISWFEREGLLTPNNAGNQCGSGGIACTAELAPSETAARLRDYWGFSESQETVGVSPQMFDEFILPYQVPILEKFGLNYYGCCEGLEQRIDRVLKQVPRLRRVSVAPKADQRSSLRNWPAVTSLSAKPTRCRSAWILTRPGSAPIYDGRWRWPKGSPWK